MEFVAIPSEKNIKKKNRKDLGTDWKKENKEKKFKLKKHSFQGYHHIRQF